MSVEYYGTIVNLGTYRLSPIIMCEGPSSVGGAMRKGLLPLDSIVSALEHTHMETSRRSAARRPGP